VAFSTNKTDRHDIADIVLKVALSIITLILTNFDISGILAIKSLQNNLKHY